MSKTNKYRRSGDLYEWIFRILFSALLIACLVLLARQCQAIEELQQKVGSTNLTIVAADTYLPEGFNVENAAYQAALQRYEIEQGHVFPEENEKTAPEAATSEAVDARKNIS